MKRLYIYIIGVIALTACHDEFNSDSLLNGTEKTPITVVTNLQTITPVTRAVDGKFETNDLLNAYIKHVTVVDAAADPLVWNADVIGTGVGPRLANFKVTALTTDHENDADNWTDHSATSALQVTDAQGLYWDDFSNSVDDAHDLRTSGHALMVYYGYGYNGGTASPALTESTGVLGWTVATNQTSGFKTSDLLYAGQQDPVAYAHGSNNTIDGRDRVLTIPYTHAMSKVTIEVICDEGFSTTTDNFANTVLTLKGVNTSCSVAAPTKTLSSFGSSSDITMQHVANTESDKFVHQSYSALIAPTVFKAGLPLATITDVDGNNYDINLSDAVLTHDKDGNATNAWSTQLVAYNATEVTPNTSVSYDATEGGLTKPGVHYMLTVTIKKQEIKVEATIQDWTAVSATGIGQILFNNDITETGDIADGLKTNGFDLYKSTTTEFGAAATKVTWNTTTSKWEYSPNIYWQNKDDGEYFRALSGAAEDNASTNDVNESLAMTQGCDVLWGTTPAHTGKDVNNNDYSYDKSAKINPRTGDVPLDFEHAMTKISVNLKTNEGDDKVDLTDATISIINTYNEGLMNLNTGNIGNLNLKLTSPAIYTLSETVNGEYKLVDQVVIPQSLVKDKDGNSRGTTPTFYQSGELTLIYPNSNTLFSGTENTSIGTGTGVYYLTSTLDKVNFTDETATIYNANLPGAVSTLTVKTPAVLYTYEEYKALDGNGDVTEEQFNDLADADKTKTAAVYYDEDEAKAYNAALPGAVKMGDFHYYKTNGSSEQHTPGELKSAGDKIMMYITLANGTRYSIELSKCKDKNTSVPITEWKRGEHYTYEITLGKEEITFRCLIKNWDEKAGSGNATLDWD